MKEEQIKKEFLEKIFAETYSGLKKYINKYMYDKNMVEDVLQETYLEVYNHADLLIDNEWYKSWIYATALNKAKKYNRNYLKTKENVSLEESEEIAIEAEYEELFSFAAIRPFLTADECQLMMMHYQYEYTYEEMARMLNLSSGSIKMKMARLRKRLKKHIKSDEI